MYNFLKQMSAQNKIWEKKPVIESEIVDRKSCVLCYSNIDIMTKTNLKGLETTLNHKRNALLLHLGLLSKIVSSGCSCMYRIIPFHAHVNFFCGETAKVQ